MKCRDLLKIHGAQLSYAILILIHGLLFLYGLISFIGSYVEPRFVPALISNVFGSIFMVTSGLIWVSMLTLFILLYREEKKQPDLQTKSKLYKIIQLIILFLIIVYSICIAIVGIVTINIVFLILFILTLVPAGYLFIKTLID